MTNNKEPFTMITGASSGIGRALAVEGAKRGWNLFLCALPGEQLKEFSEYLKERHRIEVKFFEIDLTEMGAPLKVLRGCQEQGLHVDKLINNAGIICAGGSFEKHPSFFYEKMTRLNVVSVVLLTRLFIPELKKHSNAWILNVSSAAAFLPVPYKAVYGATKAFVYSFTLALREELRGSHVKVSVLCPGSVPTNEDIQKRIAKAGKLTKISILRADRVAQIALNKMENRNGVIIPGGVNKFYIFLCHVLPNFLRLRIMSRVYKRNLSPSCFVQNNSFYLSADSNTNF